MEEIKIILSYILEKMRKFAKIIAGLMIVSGITSSIILLYPSELEPLKPEEIQIYHNIRNGYIDRQGGSVTFSGEEDVNTLLDRAVLNEIIQKDVVVNDYVCIESDSCRYKEINYSPDDYKDRVGNILRRVNKNL